MEEPQVIMLCGHCGNKTAFKVEGEYARKVFVFKDDDDYTSGSFDVQYRLLRCLACSEPTLLEDVEFIDEELHLYPADKNGLTNLPPTIQKEYNITLKVRNIAPHLCAVSARRTLEAIFTYENAVGDTLMQKVDNLIKSNRIPPLLADVAHLGRQIGNLGAHFDKEEVTEDDVTVMLDFLETILEYLYVIPAKVATVKERLSRTP